MHIQNFQKKLKGLSTICLGQWVDLVMQQSAAAIPVVLTKAKCAAALVALPSELAK